MKSEMPILFSVNDERTFLFFAERDLDPPLRPLPPLSN